MMMNSTATSTPAFFPMPIKTEKSEFGDDLVQFLLTSTFTTLTTDQQLQLKDKRPTPRMRNESGERHKRQQHYDIYNKYVWIAGSENTNRLYCYTCLMFDNSTADEWTNTGVSVFAKNFEKRAFQHQSSRIHLKCQEALQMLGKNSTEKSIVESCRLAAALHNREADSRRSILRQVVHELCRLGKQGLTIESYNELNYLECVQDINNWEEDGEPVRVDQISPEHRRQLVQAIAAAMLGKMKEELAKASFVSLQVDEAYDTGSSRQVSVILRYCVGAKVIERFAGLYDLPEWGDLQLSVGSVVLKMIEEWELEGRLVGQSYDGSSMIPAGDCTIQAVVTDAGHHAPIVHSYMHRLDLVLLYSTGTIKEVRNLIGNLRLMKEFFSAPKRRLRFTNDGIINIPPVDQPKWLSVMHEHFSNISCILNSIISNDNIWDPESVALAGILRQRLDDHEFVYLLCFYHAIFVNFIYPLVDFLDGNFSVYGSSTMEKIGKTIKDMRDLKKDVLVQSRITMSIKLNPNIHFDEDIIHHLKQLSEDIILDMTRHLQTRFKDHHNLTSFELLSDIAFPNYSTEFPKLTFKRLVTFYPLFDQERLENELINIYEDDKKRLPPAELLDYLVRNELDNVYVEVTKLLRLSLSLPAVRPQQSKDPANDDNCLLAKIKKAVASPDISEYYAVLFVERDLLQTLSNDKSFKERVIDLFAVMGDRTELIYQTVT